MTDTEPGIFIILSIKMCVHAAFYSLNTVEKHHYFNDRPGQFFLYFRPLNK